MTCPKINYTCPSQCKIFHKTNHCCPYLFLWYGLIILVPIMIIASIICMVTVIQEHQIKNKLHQIGLSVSLQLSQYTIGENIEVDLIIFIRHIQKPIHKKTFKNVGNHFFGLSRRLGGAWLFKPEDNLSGDSIWAGFFTLPTTFLLFELRTPTSMGSGDASCFLLLLLIVAGDSWGELVECWTGGGFGWTTSGDLLAKTGDLVRQIGSFFGPLFLFCPIGTLLTWEVTSSLPCL